MQKQSAGRLEIAKDIIMKLIGGTKKYMNPMNVTKLPEVGSRGVKRTFNEATNFGGTAMPQQDIEQARQLLGQIGGGAATLGAGAGAAGLGAHALLGDKKASAEDAYRAGFTAKCAAAGIDPQALLGSIRR